MAIEAIYTVPPTAPATRIRVIGGALSSRNTDSARYAATPHMMPEYNTTAKGETIGLSFAAEQYTLNAAASISK